MMCYKYGRCVNKPRLLQKYKHSLSCLIRYFQIGGIGASWGKVCTVYEKGQAVVSNNRSREGKREQDRLLCSDVLHWVYTNITRWLYGKSWFINGLSVEILFWNISSCSVGLLRIFRRARSQSFRSILPLFSRRILMYCYCIAFLT